MRSELDAKIHEQVKALCARGNVLANSGQFDLAILKYHAALDLLPGPRTDWAAATSVLAALGDAHFWKGDYAAACEILQEAMRSPGAFGNPYIHLRLGQAHLELGNTERAKDELEKPTWAAGKRCLRGTTPSTIASS